MSGFIGTGNGLARLGNSLVGAECVDACCDGAPVAECGICSPCEYPISVGASTTIVDTGGGFLTSVFFDGVFRQCTIEDTGGFSTPGPCDLRHLGSSVEVEITLDGLPFCDYTTELFPSGASGCNLVPNFTAGLLRWFCVPEGGGVNIGESLALLEALQDLINDEGIAPPWYIFTFGPFGAENPACSPSEQGASYTLAWVGSVQIGRAHV